MKEQLIEVAPREVSDLVYACCRTLGLDGGVADDVARSVATIEMHFGQGLVTFDEEVHRLSEEGGSMHASPFVRAADQWRAAEVELGETGAVLVRFSPATPVAALGAVLFDSAARGIGCSVLGSNPEASLSNLTGLDRLEQLELQSIDLAASASSFWHENRADALKYGVSVPADRFYRLHGVATTFLVSEAAVDAAWGLVDT